mgnify:CR=1 FL=1
MITVCKSAVEAINININVMYQIFLYLEIYHGDFSNSKTEKLVRDCSEDFGNSILGSVSLT